MEGIITATSMLTMFRLFGPNRSLGMVILRHAATFLTVVVTHVYARLNCLPNSYLEALADPGASGLKTFFLFTLPNILSAVVGAGLLSFTLSFDEMPVTFFVTGRDNTLPTYNSSIMRRGITSKIDAVDALIVAASAVLIIASVLLLRERSTAR